MHSPRSIAILGAGCAGTLLALELRRQKFAGRIELFDTRSSFDREQRWCFWRERGRRSPDTPIDREWESWKVIDPAGREIRRRSTRFLYSHVHAPAFFAANHGRLGSDPGTKLHLGCRVDGVSRASRSGYHLTTQRGAVSVDQIIDARHQGAAAYARLMASGETSVWQSFVGRSGEFTTGYFDPQAATLMDFRLACPEGLLFGYVLPSSRTEALVEVAVLGPTPVPPTRLKNLLDEYIGLCGNGSFQTSAQEEGVLPMSTTKFSTGDPLGILNIGAGGGSLRPSSGYAFGNILRDTAAWARAVRTGQRPLPPRLARKYRGMDAVFLRLLRDQPAVVQQAFLAMFEHVSPDRLIRFLTENSSVVDDLLLGWQMPRKEFLRAAFHMPAAAEALPAWPILGQRAG